MCVCVCVCVCVCAECQRSKLIRERQREIERDDPEFDAVRSRVCTCVSAVARSSFARISVGRERENGRT